MELQQLSEAERKLQSARQRIADKIPTGLALAKLIQKRRRSRIERARQLASNIEVQAHIRRNIDLYNLQAQLQLKNDLRHLGANVPQAARQIHEARLARLDADVADLQQPRPQLGQALLGQLSARTLLAPEQLDRSRPTLMTAYAAR